MTPVPPLLNRIVLTFPAEGKIALYDLETGQSGDLGVKGTKNGFSYTTPDDPGPAARRPSSFNIPGRVPRDSAIGLAIREPLPPLALGPPEEVVERALRLPLVPYPPGPYDRIRGVVINYDVGSVGLPPAEVVRIPGISKGAISKKRFINSHVQCRRPC